MRTLRPLVPWTALALAAPLAALQDAAPPPAPDFERADHARPEAQLELYPSMGDADTLRRAAETLREPTVERTLWTIGQWLRQHLQRTEGPERWRTFDQMLAAGTFGDEAGHAVAFGALARACGIPTVWVKTLDADWIRDYVRDPEHFSAGWRGRVFLEVFADGAWRLFDPVELRIWPEYSVAARVLPTGRWAYDKGGDPRELVLPCDPRWAAQTRAFLSGFDVSLLPVTGGRRLRLEREVYVAADRPIADWIEKRCRELGLTVAWTFNADFDRFLHEAAGQILILTAVNGRVVLPPSWRPVVLPVGEEQLAELFRRNQYGVVRRELDDGTTVLLVYGQDADSLRRAVARMDPAR